jgi:hypothetical protein
MFYLSPTLHVPIYKIIHTIIHTPHTYTEIIIIIILSVYPLLVHKLSRIKHIKETGLVLTTRGSNEGCGTRGRRGWKRGTNKSAILSILYLLFFYFVSIYDIIKGRDVINHIRTKGPYGPSSRIYTSDLWIYRTLLSITLASLACWVC